MSLENELRKALSLMKGTWCHQNNELDQVTNFIYKS